LARIPCSSLLKRTVRTAGIVFLLYAIKNACQPSSVANHGKRHGWRLGAPIESLFLTPSVLETRPSQRTVTAIQKGVFFLNFRVVATTVPFETRSPSQPGANLGLFHVNLAIPYQWRIDTSIVPIFPNASLLKRDNSARIKFFFNQTLRSSSHFKPKTILRIHFFVAARICPDSKQVDQRTSAVRSIGYFAPDRSFIASRARGLAPLWMYPSPALNPSFHMRDCQARGDSCSLPPIRCERAPSRYRRISPSAMTAKMTMPAMSPSDSQRLCGALATLVCDAATSRTSQALPTRRR
jgi:hypothetical protein